MADFNILNVAMIVDAMRHAYKDATPEAIETVKLALCVDDQDDEAIFDLYNPALDERNARLEHAYAILKLNQKGNNNGK